MLSKLKSKELIRTGNGKIESASDQDAENMLIEDILQLAAKKHITTNDKSPPETIPESSNNTDEPIDVWLQSFQLEQAPPFELNTDSVTDFFRQLPRLSMLVGKKDGIKSVLGNMCLWDALEKKKDLQKHQARKKSGKEDKSKSSNKSHRRS